MVFYRAVNFFTTFWRIQIKYRFSGLFAGLYADFRNFQDSHCDVHLNFYLKQSTFSRIFELYRNFRVYSSPMPTQHEIVRYATEEYAWRSSS